MLRLGPNQKKMLATLLEREQAHSNARTAGELGNGLNDGQCHSTIRSLERRGLVERDGRAGQGHVSRAISTWGTRWHLTPAGREAVKSC